MTAIDGARPILVVDDYQTMIRIICGFLSQLGYRDVDHARDVPAALDMIRRKNYRLVLSDWYMEPLTGMDLLREIRAMPGREKTRFIMVTAESRTDRVMEARRAGADNYLVKPFNAATLKTKIDQVFGE